MKMLSWGGALLLIGGVSQLLCAQDFSPQDLFTQLDKNGDGRIEAKELPDSQFRFFERVVRIGDQNQDGMITLEELTAALKQDPVDPADPPPAAPKTAPTQAPASAMGKPQNSTGMEDDRRDRIFKTLDLNGDGKVTREEVPERAREVLAPLFDSIGADVFSLEQFHQFHAADPSPQSTSRVQQDGDRTQESIPSPQDGTGRHPPRLVKLRLFELLDTDGNGKLTPDELARINQIFHELDVNEDGELGPAELFGLPQATGPGATKTPHDVPYVKQDIRGQADAHDPVIQLFSRLDTDGDGALSPQETPAQFRDHFSRFDTNGDGRLTPPEFQRGLEQLKQQRPQ